MANALSTRFFGGHVCSYKKHTDWVYTLTWSPNGERIASAGRGQGILIWDARNGTHYLTCGAPQDQINCIAWSPKPDSQYMAVAGKDKTVLVYNLIDGTEEASLKGHEQSVNVVVWSPDGQFLASGGDDAIVRIWDIKTRQQIGIYREHFSQSSQKQIEDRGVNTLTWSPDGTEIASAGGDRVVNVWKVKDLANVASYKNHTHKINALAWSPDGALIASVDKSVHIWNAKTGENVRTLVQTEPVKKQGISLVRTWFREEVIGRDNADDNQGPTEMMWSLDKKDPAIKNDIKVLQTGPSKKRDGFVLLTTLLREINQRIARDKANDAQSIVTTVAWSPEPDAKSVAFASRNQVYVFDIFDIEEGRVHPYREHTDWIRTLAWSPDGKCIASSGDDKIVRVWDVIVPYHHHPNNSAPL